MHTTRQFLAALALALLLTVGGNAIPAAQAQPMAQQDPSVLTSDAERAARILNQHRADAGLPPLAVNPLLTRAANLHIQDMISNNVWGHTGSDGSNVRQRVARTGYVVDGWAGENWAAYQTIEVGIDWWMGHGPHRQNVLNRSYKEMGIGTAPHPHRQSVILVVVFTTGGSSSAASVVYQPAARSGPAPVAVQNGSTHTIRTGETLWTIASAYGISWQSLAQANGMHEGSLLQIGAQLTIPGRGGPTQANPAQNAPDVESSGVIHTVVAGETLWSISARYSVSWQDLARLNRMGENSILAIGATLEIPASAGATVAAPATDGADAAAPQGRTYTVVAGDTLWRIAAFHSVDWYELMAINGFGENTILSIGQVVRIP
jgi:uncharacterized protein YkwD